MPPNKPDKGKEETAADTLRSNAGKRLLTAKKARREQPQSDGESQRLRHELEINHIELKIQNEELIRARDETDIALEKFTDLFDSGPIGFLSLTRDGTVTAVSHSTASLLAMDRCQILGKRFGLFVANEFRHAFADLLTTTFANLTKEGCNVALVSEDDAPLFVHLVAKATQSRQECNVALIDITERTRTEDALRYSELRYRSVVEDQTELIFRYRPDGSYTFVNAVVSRFFGKTEEELVGERWHPEAVADDIPMIEEQLRLLCPAHPVVVIENRVIAGSGEIRWMQFVNRAFFDDKGRLTETQAVGRDITERKQAEELVRRYAHEVQDLYNNAPCGYHSLDEHGVFIRINDTELRWLGYTREEVIGVLSFNNVVTPEGANAFLRNYPRYRKQEEGRNIEYEMVRKDGSRFPIIVNADFVRDDTGRFLMTRSMVFDNTMNKRSEKALKQYAGRLLVLEEDLRERIASDLHDDVAQVLAALGLNLAHITNRLKGKSRERFIGLLEDSRKLILEVNRSVRNLMVELHSHQLDDFGLSAALRSHIEQYASRAGITVEFIADSEFPRLTAKAETAFFRITQEALQNIMKHAAATKVTVSLKRVDGYDSLTITDDGKGFLPNEVPLHTSGTGWGLRNMRERAELIGGSFRVHSVVGKGTTLEVEVKGQDNI